MSTTIRDQIIEQVDRLGESERQKLLDFAHHLTAREGTPGRDLLRFAGVIDPADVEAMSTAIQEGCENIDPHAW